MTTSKFGQLALIWCGKRLPVQVLRSQAGYYLGTATEEGPCSRESLEYWSSETAACNALATKEWTQRDEP